MATATKAKTAKPVTKAEEKEAALKELAAPITKASFDKVQRVHEIKDLIAPYLAEIEAAQGFVYAEMDRKGVNTLTRNGVKVVSRNPQTRRTVDAGELMEDFPEIAGLYTKTTSFFRVDWKKPVAWVKKALGE